ncbi:MAG: hypothetical protein ACT4PP_16290 [Sporichthyaceae bacterium]
MSKTLSIRVDEITEAELSALAEQAGSRNAAVVSAIRDAYQRHIHDRLRTESAALNNDPEYRAEVQAARAAMGDGDAW